MFWRRLSRIVKKHNWLCMLLPTPGNMPFTLIIVEGNHFTDTTAAERAITKEIPDLVQENEAYQNALRHAGRQNARIELDHALEEAILGRVNTGRCSSNA